MRGGARLLSGSTGTGLAALAAAALLIVPLFPGPVAAQEPEDDPPASVELEDFAWLEGTWRGTGPQGSTAEIHYMRPRAGVLPSIFRLWQGDRVVTLEAISLVEETDGLFLYVRHFDPQLVPMEDEAIRLRLVERHGDAFHFENVDEGRNPRTSVLTRTGEGFVSSSHLVDSEGETSEIRVEYERVGGP